MRRELADVFARSLGDDDHLFLLPIYYAGGRAERDISSDDIAADAAQRGAPVEALRDRPALARRLGELAREDDTILVMGARDDSLRDLCRDLVVGLQDGSPN